MDTGIFSLSLTEIIKNVLGGVEPAYLRCPIQEGVPIALSFLINLLIFIAGLAFFFAVFFAAFNYITSFGNEDKAKKAREGLKWAAVGATIVIVSYTVVPTIANFFFQDESNQGQVQANLVIRNGIIALRDKNGAPFGQRCSAGIDTISPADRAQQEQLQPGQGLR